MQTYLNHMRCTNKQTYENKAIMQWACANDGKGMYRAKIDMKNIKPDKTIVMLINLLNQEGIDIEEDCGTRGEGKSSSNAEEDNLQSSNEAGNNNIDTQSNNMVVDNDIQRKASRQESIEENEVQRQASWKEPKYNEVTEASLTERAS